MAGPRALAFGPDHHLYVSNAITQQILKFQGPFGAEPGAFIASIASTRNGAITFGPDGKLYAAGNGGIDRYDGATGELLSEFVLPSESGGLSGSLEGSIIFGLDRTGDGQPDLYASSSSTDEVLLYDGTDGSFLETLVPSGLGGLDLPGGLAIDGDGNLLVAKVTDGHNDLLRYGVASQAVFTVILSQPSAVPVTVEFSTADGTAIAGSDYRATSGVLTFAPGQTTRTILVPTYDDETGEPTETFGFALSNPTGASIVDGTAVGSIIDDDSNGAPVAIDDAATAETNVEQVIDVLANDSDPDADALVIDSVESPSVGGGTVVINLDHTISYTSAPGFTGIDSFSYTASDGQGGTATATVTVDVTEATAAVMYVSDISFQSRKGGKEWRAIFEIRSDSNLNGIADDADSAAANVSISVWFDGQLISGQTDANGIFRTDWFGNFSKGATYYANVDGLMKDGYTWNQLLDLEDDSDAVLGPDDFFVR
jgi:hypothetical protein